MYTDNDLDNAVTEGIFSADAVANFKAQHCVIPTDATTSSPALVDEESLKLLTSFNDIFVVIACALVLFTASSLLDGFNSDAGLFVAAPLVALCAWGFSEYFVRKRKMALPALFLLVVYAQAVFFTSWKCFEMVSGSHTSPLNTMGPSMIAVFALNALAVFAYWRRFKVPAAIAVCTMAVIVLVAAILNIITPIAPYATVFIFIAGMLVFSYAMRWDMQDTKRIGYQSDVGFWLHLLAAPLIIHPIFTTLGVFDGDLSVLTACVIIGLYIVLSIVSLTIDRRALMLSSLVYVIAALSNIVKSYGSVNSGFLTASLIVGLALLAVAIFWRPIRSVIVKSLPTVIRHNVPRVS